MTPVVPPYGAFVLSLDFEIHWGVRDTLRVDGPYRRNLVGVRAAVPRMLELFEEYEVGATWATVGFLFARDREQLQAMSPSIRPQYSDAALDPYGEEIGMDEDDDLFHYAPSLIELIRSTPRQEIGSHTFSHYYCREPGQTKEAFEADLASAVEIAAERGISLRSLVFPRNQVNDDYLDVLPRLGFTSFRSNPDRSLYSDPWLRGGPRMRIGRFVDDYVALGAKNLASWDELNVGGGLCRIPASFFLRPFTPRRARLDGARARRLTDAIRAAGKSASIFHLWWHPHNFGVHLDENVAFLRRILDAYRAASRSHGLRSMTMGEVAENVLDAAHPTE